jgi:hypothetical protein
LSRDAIRPGHRDIASLLELVVVLCAVSRGPSRLCGDGSGDAAIAPVLPSAARQAIEARAQGRLIAVANSRFTSTPSGG